MVDRFSFTNNYTPACNSTTIPDRSAELTDIHGIVAGVCSLVAEIKGTPEFQLPATAAEVCQRLIEGKYPGAIFVANPQGDNDSIHGFNHLNRARNDSCGKFLSANSGILVIPNYRSQNMETISFKMLKPTVVNKEFLR